MGPSASTSATTPPIWGTYPSALSRPPKLWDGKLWTLWVRALTPKTQSYFQMWRLSSRAPHSPPAPPLPTSRSSCSSRTWWWWPNLTAGLSTREPTGPKRPNPACMTRGRPATQRTPSPRQPGSVPNPLRLYASSSPSLALITGWCRRSVQTTTFRRSRTSSTLDESFTRHRNTDFSHALWNHTFRFSKWIWGWIVFICCQKLVSNISECSLSRNMWLCADSRTFLW